MSDGYRALAAAVIVRAIKDANGRLETGPLPRTERRSLVQDAQAFLHPDHPELVFYCDALDLDPVALCEAIRKNGEAFMRGLRREKAPATAPPPLAVGG